MKTLKIEELSKNFGTTEVLRKINLEIDEGNFLVLLGPSGCGKSTLLNIIAGLETINEGNVFIDDYNVSKVEPKDRNIAMVFQSYALYPSMNVKENMIFGLKQAKTSKEKIEEQLQKVSTFLQVDKLLERKPSQLSQMSAFYSQNKNNKLKQIHGKTLSYNNYNDIFAALTISKSLPKNTGTVIPHHLQSTEERWV